MGTLNQILLIQQITLSVIIILITLLISNGIFQKGTNQDLIKDFEEFKKDYRKDKREIIKNFIEWKKYQYSQILGLTSFLVSFSMFVCSVIILSFRDILVNVIGWLPYLTLLGCDFYIIYRFCKITVPNATDISINNIKKLLQEDSFLNTNLSPQNL